MKKAFSLLIICISILSFAQVKVPFVGKRSFNTIEGYSGTGTPAYYVDVKKNGDVHFGYVQVNQANGTETTEEINVGKYNTGVMKVQFKKFNENFLIKFNKEKIYLTDEAGNIIKSEDCCSVTEAEESSCICESAFYQ
ncbi:hypothetical protein ACM39_09945 [Chryseobacterium sp. FH2]|uniref:hypothetical protein n=1 Tax=Chryseobacterium sp. FH2 TaxID=1674291 RepID=UPI00065B0036|nr:hypothetical protein [Chryseobacterium sp. FH2]KMQ68282.1 hypothetical protein ACM39_09945 [Chryseobacterium sp. FH2]